MTLAGSKIKKLREEAGLTLQQLANSSGVGQSTISDIETGKAKNPKMTTLKKLADYFGVSLDYLLSTEEKLNITIDSLEKINKMAKEALGSDTKIKTNKNNPKNEIETIAAHLEGKNITPQKMKLLEQYIDALFDDEE